MKRITLATVMMVLVIVSVGIGPPDENAIPRGTTTYSSYSETFHATSPIGVLAPQQSLSWACTIYASDPMLQLPSVVGDGFQTCSGTFNVSWMDITLQRKLGGPWWKNLAKNTATGYQGFATMDVSTLCVAGVHTYRIVVDGWTSVPNSLPIKRSVRSENEPRFSC